MVLSPPEILPCPQHLSIAPFPEPRVLSHTPSDQSHSALAARHGWFLKHMMRGKNKTPAVRKIQV